MRPIKRMITGCLVFFASTSAFAGNKISICTDTNFWYPFTFVRNNQVMGLHVDIIDKALRDLGYEPSFVASDWTTCLNNAKQGLVDGVATASYLDDRATYLNYPQGAATDKLSPMRVTQVEYVVITPTENAKGEKNTYKFSGDLQSIPTPIRVPKNYAVANDLKQAGLTLKEGPHSLDNFKDLLKDHEGSVVDLEEVAEYLNTQPEFSGKLEVQRKPLNLKSYYLAFSKKGSIKPKEAEQIWQEIAKVRDDTSLMADYLKKY